MTQYSALLMMYDSAIYNYWDTDYAFAGLITQYGSTVYIGIAMVFVFPPFSVSTSDDYTV